MLAADIIASDRLPNALFFFIVTLALYLALAQSNCIAWCSAWHGFGIVRMCARELARRLRVPRLLVFLALSYSIYLIHNPVASLTVRLFDDWRAAFVAVAATGIASGIFYYLILEKPALRLLSR